MRAEALKPFALFADLDEDERDAFARRLVERRLQPGELAFREGSEGEGLILLASGRLRLRSRRKQGVVGTLEGPAQLGLAALVAAGPREATAVAEGACTLYLLARADFDRLIDDAPGAACRVACAVAAELAALARECADPLAGVELG